MLSSVDRRLGAGALANVQQRSGARVKSDGIKQGADQAGREGEGGGVGGGEGARARAEDSREERPWASQRGQCPLGEQRSSRDGADGEGRERAEERAADDGLGRRGVVHLVVAVGVGRQGLAGEATLAAAGEGEGELDVSLRKDVARRADDGATHVAAYLAGLSFSALSVAVDLGDDRPVAVLAPAPAMLNFSDWAKTWPEYESEIER